MPQKLGWRSEALQCRVQTEQAKLIASKVVDQEIMRCPPQTRRLVEGKHGNAVFGGLFLHRRFPHNPIRRRTSGRASGSVPHWFCAWPCVWRGKASPIPAIRQGV